MKCFGIPGSPMALAIVAILVLHLSTCVFGCVEKCTKGHGSSPLLSHTIRNGVFTSRNDALHKESEGNHFLKEVSLHDVRLDLDRDSFHWRAQQTNLEYLLWLDVDRLVWSFRKLAGFKTPGVPYGGWEAADSQLRGHFVGHYMSATAQMWASTHNKEIKQKMTSVVSALKKCQDSIGTGYLSAFSADFFDGFEALNYVWAPYYTIHKIMAGLLDQYTLAGNAEALEMANRMADYFFDRVQNVTTEYSIGRHWKSLETECGGMNDVLYRLYRINGNQKHLLLAHLFDKPRFLGVLAMKADDISGFHVNTHIPLVIGAQMRYEVTGDELYKDIGTFFMDIVNASHAFATGGTSVSEHWNDPKRLGDKLNTENQESCTTYNMLKVSRNLFRWTREAKYADYYERALTNGVLGIQRGTEPGVMIYMLPLGHGVSKARSYHGWGTKNNSFWCCYGTGIESFSKLGDSIYFEEGGSDPVLYVTQYISSSLNWKSANIALTQKVKNVVSWIRLLQVTFTVSKSKESGISTLKLRVPTWTDSSDAIVLLNGEKLSIPSPGSFLSVSRNWKTGDTIVLELPLTLRTEKIEDDRSSYASTHAILYGPYLLAGLSNGDYEIKVGSDVPVSKWISPVPSAYNNHLISLFQEAHGLSVFVSNTNGSITMESSPLDGDDSSVRTTFRLILKDSIPSSASTADPETLIGKVVLLEPFDHPGMVVGFAQDHRLVMGNTDTIAAGSSEFQIVRGLDGTEGSVSLQSASRKRCFVRTSLTPGQSVKLSCRSGSRRHGGFEQTASFKWSKGIKQYHPISFVAKGTTRSYLLEPLLSLRDESYNVYFNIL